ncbi:MAG: hypothetical protein FJX33_10300 [Alphaproteobacteria bacterium]|nr:hypothetical protein [Alphaproteobacteria bacterium]
MGDTTRRIRAAGGKAEWLGVDGVELYALCDGYVNMELSRFPDIKRGIGDDLAIANGQDLNDMKVSVNAFLLRHGKWLCLVDAGDGIWRGYSGFAMRLRLPRSRSSRRKSCTHSSVERSASAAW